MAEKTLAQIIRGLEAVLLDAGLNEVDISRDAMVLVLNDLRALHQTADED